MSGGPIDYLMYGLSCGALIVGFVAAIAAFIGILWLLTMAGIIIGDRFRGTR